MKSVDYSKFKIIDSNRIITESRVNSLVQSIKRYGYYNSKPITVNRNYEVVDGQHRLEACKILGLPVCFEIDYVNVNDSMVVLNTTSSVWQLADFIRHYSIRNTPSYPEFQTFINSNNYAISHNISLYAGSQGGRAKDIRSGKFIQQSEHLSKYIDLIEFLRPKVSFCMTTKFIRAIIAFVGNKNTTEKQITKLKLNCYAITECAQVDQYIIQFNKILRIKPKNN